MEFKEKSLLLIGWYHILNILIFNILYNIGSGFSNSFGYALIGSIMFNGLASIMNLIIVFVLKKLRIENNFITSLILFVLFIFTFDLSVAIVDQSSIMKLFNLIIQGDRSFSLYAEIILTFSGFLSFFISINFSEKFRVSK
jgi:hypothetical protein